MKHHKINIPKVYITTVPYNFRSYYLWLLYGLYELNEQGKLIKFPKDEIGRQTYSQVPTF